MKSAGASFGIEWLLYVEPALRCPFPPPNGPPDTMTVFMEMAEQMCEAREVELTGEVSFQAFVEFFSQELPSRSKSQVEDLYHSYNQSNLNTPQSFTMVSLMAKNPLKDPKQRKQLQMAASFGHTGVTKAVLKDFICELKS